MWKAERMFPSVQCLPKWSEAYKNVMEKGTNSSDKN